MGNPNDSDNLELHEADKDNMGAFNGNPRPSKAAEVEEKHVSTAYPSTGHGDGSSLRVCPHEWSRTTPC